MCLSDNSFPPGCRPPPPASRPARPGARMISAPRRSSLGLVLFGSKTGISILYHILDAHQPGRRSAAREHQHDCARTVHEAGRECASEHEVRYISYGLARAPFSMPWAGPARARQFSGSRAASAHKQVAQTMRGWPAATGSGGTCGKSSLVCALSGPASAPTSMARKRHAAHEACPPFAISPQMQ